MNSNDKEYLRKFTLQIIKEIRERSFPPPLQMTQKVEMREVGSGGWSAKIGRFRGYQCSIEIWFDLFTSHENRKIYYGVYSRQSQGIRKIVSLSKTRMGEHISVGVSDWSDDDDLIQLQKPLRLKEFGQPIFEEYPKKNEYIYGIYEHERFSLQRNETKKLIARIVEFFISINDMLILGKTKEDAETYRHIENRKAVQRHLQRERNRRLAFSRKQLDNFVCRVCGFDYAKTYGKLGKDFAEAHHIVPLSTNNKQRVSKIDDLITVCANCHRMLHRMEGEAGDIVKLKKIVRGMK